MRLHGGAATDWGCSRDEDRRVQRQVRRRLARWGLAWVRAEVEAGVVYKAWWGVQRRSSGWSNACGR